MSNKDRYKVTHKIAKLICFMLIVLLLVLNRTFDLVYLDILAVAVWFWGVNPVGYLVESVMHWRHNHDKV